MLGQYDYFKLVIEQKTEQIETLLRVVKDIEGDLAL